MTMENFVKKFKHTLNNGIIIFKYKKKNGEVRKAVGTTHPAIIPASVHAERYKKPLHEKIKNLINYFDIEKKEWRSFYLDKLEKTISIVFIKKEGQPSTYHITEEDRRLAIINNEILEIERQRLFYKNQMKKIMRGTFHDGILSPVAYESIIKVFREKSNKTMKTLKAERKEIMKRKDLRVRKEMSGYYDEEEGV